MAEVKNRDAEVITLGSGDLMVKEYDATTGVPAYTEFKLRLIYLVVSKAELL